MTRLALALFALAAPAVAQRAPPAPPVIQPLTVEVTLSPAAATRMAAIREGITVGATFYGEATPAARQFADQTGQIGFGREEVTLPGRNGSATIIGRGMTDAKLNLLKERTLQVLITAYSARRTTQNNLLDCSIFKDSVAVATPAPVRITCKLIGEA